MQAHNTQYTPMQANKDQRGPTKPNKAHGNQCKATREGASSDGNAPRWYGTSFGLRYVYFLFFY